MSKVLRCPHCRAIRIAGQRAVLPRKLHLVEQRRGGILVECRVCGHQWVCRAASVLAIWAETHPLAPLSST